MSDQSPRRIDVELDGSVEVPFKHEQHRKEDSFGEHEKKVYYHQGATRLFLALEESSWCEAADILEKEPEQAQIWVISTGTQETVFAWSTWKRLPLHEACRRQAPTWLVSALLKEYSAAASEATQFGELPLHLAVSCSASPEVVNLLLVSFWPAIAITDQSGRNPLQLLQESEVTEIARHESVFDSLERAQTMWEDLQEANQQELEGLKQQHLLGIKEIQKQHQVDLAVEHAQVEELLDQLEQTEAQLNTSTKVELELHKTMDLLENKEERHKQEFALLQQKLAEMDQARIAEVEKVASLEGVVDDKEKEISRLEKHIAELQGTVQKLSGFKKGRLARRLGDTQEKLRALLDSFVDLHDTLDGHDEELDEILEQEGVPPAVVPDEEEETQEDPDLEEEINADDAMHSAAMAASTALAAGR